MTPEHEQTWRDLVADAAEQRRRAELFPELVKALDIAWSYVPDEQVDIAALLVRCRKPVQP